MSLSALFIVVYPMSSSVTPCIQIALPVKTNQTNFNKTYCESALTFSPHWKCANTWSHQTWSWKKTHNIWWTFCQESYGPSPSPAICLFSSPLQPFYRLLSCWVALVRASLFAQGAEGEALDWCKPNCGEVCAEGQINCVKVCSHILCSGCH